MERAGLLRQLHVPRDVQEKPMLTFNGQPFRSGDFRRALEDGIFEQVRRGILDKLSGVRDPQTGQPPRITVTGCDLKNLSVKVEGSEALIAEINRRLGR